MTHNPSNPNCDKNQYGDAPDVRCTCDEDGDDMPAPSVGGPVVDSSFPSALIGPTTVAGRVVLTGRLAVLHSELEAATRNLDAARKLLAPAEARWRKAMDAYMEALIAG